VLRRWGTLRVFYSETGAYPIAALGKGMGWQAGPLYWVRSPTALHAVFALCLLVTLAFTVGFGARFVKWLLLPVLFTLHARTPPLFTGGEAVLHSQALYAALLPVGAAFSVDTWLSARARGAKAEAARPTAITSLVYPLILLQLSVIYYFNMRAKTGPSWHEGVAVARTLGAATLATDFGSWVRALPSPLLRALSYGTLAIEAGLPLLLLNPWRRRYTHALAGLLMLSLHGGIYLTLEVGSFSAAMLSYVPLLWHPRALEENVVLRTPRARKGELIAVALLFYVGAARLSHDLVLWPARPQLPMPALLDKATKAFGLLQPWMMFSPDPPERDFIIVTDAVTRKGHHFDPWRQVASGRSEPLTELPRSIVRAHVFTRYENYLSESNSTPMHPFFSRWVLSQRGPDGEAVERFDAWLMIVSTEPGRVIPASTLEARVGVMPLPFGDALPVQAFEATGVWAPERAFDRKIVPDGTDVLTPVSANMSAGCPHLTLDLGAPHELQAAFFQADSFDRFLIDGSLDGKTFQPLGEMPRVDGWQYLSRVVTLPGTAARFVRLRPAQSRGLTHFLSEVALFDHAISLPAIPRHPDETFLTALTRPAVVGIVSGSNHPSPDCPAEDPRVQASSRAR
jgi:hypothetical protein